MSRASFNPAGRPRVDDPRTIPFSIRLKRSEKEVLERAAEAAGISVGRLLVESAMTRASRLAASRSVIEAITGHGRALNAAVRRANAGEDPDRAEAARIMGRIAEALDGGIPPTEPLVAALSAISNLVRQFLRHSPKDKQALALLARIDQIMEA